MLAALKITASCGRTVWPACHAHCLWSGCPDPGPPPDPQCARQSGLASFTPHPHSACLISLAGSQPTHPTCSPPPSQGAAPSLNRDPAHTRTPLPSVPTHSKPSALDTVNLRSPSALLRRTARSSRKPFTLPSSATVPSYAATTSATSSFFCSSSSASPCWLLSSFPTTSPASQPPQLALRGRARLRRRSLGSTASLPPDLFHLALKFFKLSAVDSHGFSIRTNILFAFREAHGLRSITCARLRQN